MDNGSFLAAALAPLLALALLRGYFEGLVLGSGLLRGQPREMAPGAFMRLAYGETHYVWKRAGPAAAARPLVVLIHGFGGSCDVFRRSGYLTVLLTEGFDVLTYDNWGHGFSDGPDITYSVELFVSQLSELLLALRIEQPLYVLGFSLGGAIATAFTHQYPGRVGKLVLQAPAVARRSVPLLLRVLIGTPYLLELVCRIVIPYFGEGANRGNKAAPRACFRLLRTVASSGNFMRHGHAETLFTGLAMRRLPLLVLWGGQDRLVPYAGAARLLQLAPEAELVLSPDADHMDFAERQDEQPLTASVAEAHCTGTLFRTAIVRFLGTPPQQPITRHPQYHEAGRTRCGMPEPL